MGEARAASPGSATHRPAAIGNTPRGATQARREQRQAQYEEVVRLRRQGVSAKGIACELGLGRNTVRRWLQAGQAPEHRRSGRRSRLDRYADYLKQRWEKGWHNAAQLFREIQKQGYRGGDSRVRQWVARQLKADLPPERQHAAKRSAVVVERFPVPSARATAWLLLREEEELEKEQRLYTEHLVKFSPEIREAQRLARRFSGLVKHQQSEPLDGWLEEAETSELRGLAAGIRRDLSAVKAALSLPWSNGQTEGQVQRLKLLKRQMHGRARPDLLKQRMLCAA